VLAETVRRYERPGMMYRFFTQLCVDRMGWRGYTAVRENGDIVRCGTLMLGEVRREVVERRRLRLAEENREKLASVAQGYGQDGEQAPGVSALQPANRSPRGRAWWRRSGGLPRADARRGAGDRAAGRSEAGARGPARRFPSGQIVDGRLIVLEGPHTHAFALSAIRGKWRISVLGGGEFGQHQFIIRISGNRRDGADRLPRAILQGRGAHAGDLRRRHREQVGGLRGGSRYGPADTGLHELAERDSRHHAVARLRNQLRRAGDDHRSLGVRYPGYGVHRTGQRSRLADGCAVAGKNALFVTGSGNATT